MYDRPHDYGIGHIRPFPQYRQVYRNVPDLASLAYHFCYSSVRESSGATKDARMHRKAFTRAIGTWKKAWLGKNVPVLRGVCRTRSGVLIQDTRTCAKAEFCVLAEEVYESLTHLAAPTKLARAVTLLGYDELLDRKLVLKIEDVSVSLVTQPWIGYALRAGATYSQIPPDAIDFNQTNVRLHATFRKSERLGVPWEEQLWQD
jgi:hypothetical protein